MSLRSIAQRRAQTENLNALTDIARESEAALERAAEEAPGTETPTAPPVVGPPPVVAPGPIAPPSAPAPVPLPPPPAPTGGATKLADQLVALIPAEAIGLYVPAIGAAVSGSEPVRWACLIVVAVLTPVWVTVSYLEQAAGKARSSLPWLEMAVGLLAFLAWSTAVPGGPWDDLGLAPWVGTLIVAGTTAVLFLVIRLRAAWANIAGA